MNSIFISGISTGIGKGLAIYYANKGLKVYGISRRQLDYQHPNISHVQADIKKPLERPLTSLFSKCEHLNLAIMNAGVLGKIETLEKSDEQELKEVMEINLWGQKRSIDFLLKRYPKLDNVIAISSGASINGNRGWNAYGISKSALNMLIKIYAAENPNTHFCSFAPGLVDTDMQDQLWEVSEEEFPTVKGLHLARNSEAMPTPDVFAQKFEKALPKIKKCESGSYLDIRTI